MHVCAHVYTQVRQHQLRDVRDQDYCRPSCCGAPLFFSPLGVSPSACRQRPLKTKCIDAPAEQSIEVDGWDAEGDRLRRLCDWLSARLAAQGLCSYGLHRHGLYSHGPPPSVRLALGWAGPVPILVLLPVSHSITSAHVLSLRVCPSV